MEWVHLANICFQGIGRSGSAGNYAFKKTDHKVFIDIRSLGKDGVSVDFSLLEPYHLDILNRQKEIWQDSQVHIVSSLDPWVVTSWRSQDSLIQKIGED